MISNALKRAMIVIVVMAGIITLDYQMGPYIAFPVAFTIPIALATWWYGRWVGIGVATLMALVRVGGVFTWELQVTNLMTYVITNAIVREVAFVALVLLVDCAAKQQRELARNVQVLEGILPICSHCKKIRNEADEWEPVEQYISHRSNTEFSHSICSECMQLLYGDVLKRRQQRDQ